MPRLHLEQIREVTADCDLEIETHRLHPVVHEVQILVNASTDRAAEHESEGTWRDLAVFSGNGPIGEEYTRSVMGDVAGVEQVPKLAVCIDAPAADQPGVEKVEALVTRPRNLAVAIGDQNAISLMQSELRWAHGNFKSHWEVPSSATVGDARIF